MLSTTSDRSLVDLLRRNACDNDRGIDLDLFLSSQTLHGKGAPSPLTCFLVERPPGNKLEYVSQSEILRHGPCSTERNATCPLTGQDQRQANRPYNPHARPRRSVGEPVAARQGWIELRAFNSHCRLRRRPASRLRNLLRACAFAVSPSRQCLSHCNGDSASLFRRLPTDPRPQFQFQGA